MASLSLGSQLWLTSAANLLDSLVLPLQPGGTIGWPNMLEVREYAGGEYLAVSRPGVSQVWTPTLKRLTRTQMRGLQARAGALHWARDPWGGKVACTWANPVTTTLGFHADAGDQMFSVAVTLVSSTWSEA